VPTAQRRPPGRFIRTKQQRPAAGTRYFTRAEMVAWIQGTKAGEFDDLT
jgi:hypothetical protein